MMKLVLCFLLLMPSVLFAAQTEITTENIAEAIKNAPDAPTPPQILVNEAEIPVTLEAAKKTEAAENPFMKMGVTFLVIAVLGGGAYFLIRKYSFSMGSKNQHTQIKLITQHYLGPRKSIAMIRVAGESILVGITDNNINLIKTLSLLDEDIPEETPSQFANVFQASQNKEAAQNPAPVAGEDFSIGGIKDFVSNKLKNMRSLE